MVNGLAEGVGNAPTPAMPVLFSRQAQPAYICLPSKLAARVGLAPTLPGLTSRRATLTLPGNGLPSRSRAKAGAVGRIPTCIIPFRRRMPQIIRPRQRLKLARRAVASAKVGQRGRNCTCGPPVPGRTCCCYTTRCDALKNLHPMAVRKHPMTTGCFSLQLRERNGLPD